MAERTLGVFARAPVPGHVKTRLARAIGPRAAATLYRRLGRLVVAATRGSGYRTVVWFTPPGARSVVRAWLDGLGVAGFRLQSGGGLGARLIHAFGRLFAEGDRAVVIIGTDCPGLARRTVARAFAALRSHDLVLGPAKDGGYYLIGLRSPEPGLFRGIPWSTPAVTRATLARARALGLRLLLLDPLRDVDTERDARALGLLESPPKHRSRSRLRAAAGRRIGDSKAAND